MIINQLSQFEGAKTRVMANSGLSEEHEVNVGMQQGHVLPPFFLQLWWMSLN